jgi:hypothetical protein
MNREPLRRRLIVQRRIWGSWKIDDMFSIGLSVLEKGDWIGVLGEEAHRREHIGVKHASTKKRGDSTKSIDSSAIQSFPGQKTIYMQEGGRVRPLSLYNQTPHFHAFLQLIFGDGYLSSLWSHEDYEADGFD